MILELRQPLPMLTSKGKCRALFLLDYGPDSPTLFLCALNDSGEMWWFRQQDVRLEANVTFGTAALPPA